jgi:hypothetical protein
MINKNQPAADYHVLSSVGNWAKKGAKPLFSNTVAGIQNLKRKD